MAAPKSNLRNLKDKPPSKEEKSNNLDEPGAKATPNKKPIKKAQLKDGRKIKPKTESKVQMNLTVSPSFKAMVIQLAYDNNCHMSELVVDIIMQHVEESDSN